MGKQEQKMIDRLRPLLDAIREVETGGIDNPEIAFGDNDTSFGPYQISDAYWEDANMPAGKWQDVGMRSYAEEVMVRYWRRYVGNIEMFNGWEKLARIHNGGPTGHKKTATEKYWSRVKGVLKGQVIEVVGKL